MNRPVFLLLFTAAFMASSFTGDVATYTISKEDSKLKWYGERVKYGHYGSVDLKSGELIVDKNSITGGSFTVDMTSIRDLDMDDEKRAGRLVGHLKSDDFFDVENHPETRFVINRARKEESENGNYLITGDLTIRGNTSEISFPAQVDIDGGELKAQATVVFDRTKFGVQYGSGSFFDELGDRMISDELKLEVELVGHK